MCSTNTVFQFREGCVYNHNSVAKPLIETLQQSGFVVWLRHGHWVFSSSETTHRIKAKKEIFGS